MIFTDLFEISDLWRHLANFFIISKMTWCVRRVVQRKQICQLDTHLDYNNLGTTITTCRLFTIESVDNQQSRREHVHSINKYQKLNVSRLPLLESYNPSRLSHRSGRPSTRIGYRQTGISRCIRTLRSYHGAIGSYDPVSYTHLTLPTT